MSTHVSVSEQVLLVYVALQRLQHDRSTTEIAEELGVSRFKVGRMVAKARELGLIEIVPKLSAAIDVELSRKLAREFGLREALVAIPPGPTDLHAREVIASVAARYLSDNVTDDLVVGFGPGRTIIEICDRISDMAVCDIVQLTGVATRAPEESLQSIYKISRISSGKMFPLHAPLVATTEQAAQAIIAQPTVHKALLRIDKVDMSVLTIGGWPESSLLADMLAESGEMQSLLDKGAVAEIGTTVLNQNGQVINDIDTRTIGISTAQLTRVPHRIGLGGGMGKRDAVLATLNSGLIDMIVTDRFTAVAALERSGVSV